MKAVNGVNVVSRDAVDYRALVEGTAVMRRADAGVLAVGGADRADFLHRMTSNDIKGLGPGQATVTVLTSPVARIQAVFGVLHRHEALWLLPAAGQTERLASLLRGQIFFMDQAEVSDLSQQQQRLRVMGPGAADTLRQLGFAVDGPIDGQQQEADGLLAVWQEQYDVPGYELLVPTERTAATLGALAEAGGQPLSEEAAYHARRLEWGRPLPGAELTEEYTPLEAGLAWACAENKGCYTGQEIIARQITYDKVTRKLVTLLGAGVITLGSEVSVDGRSVGRVTSRAFSPQVGQEIALAVVKRPYHLVGVQVRVGGVDAQVIEPPAAVGRGESR